MLYLSLLKFESKKSQLKKYKNENYPKHIALSGRNVNGDNINDKNNHKFRTCIVEPREGEGIMFMIRYVFQEIPFSFEPSKKDKQKQRRQKQPLVGVAKEVMKKSFKTNSFKSN